MNTYTVILIKSDGTYRRKIVYIRARKALFAMKRAKRIAGYYAITAVKGRAKIAY